jgi:hypothetical protein
MMRRASYQIIFGDGANRWSLGDPGHPLVARAQWHARYSKPLSELDSKALLLAELVSDLHYLVYTCPTTKLACQKLALLRTAVRGLEMPEGDDSGRHIDCDS